jgi:hypothetical protein
MQESYRIRSPGGRSYDEVLAKAEANIILETIRDKTFEKATNARIKDLERYWLIHRKNQLVTDHLTSEIEDLRGAITISKKDADYIIKRTKEVVCIFIQDYESMINRMIRNGDENMTIELYEGDDYSRVESNYVDIPENSSDEVIESLSSIKSYSEA